MAQKIDKPLSQRIFIILFSSALGLSGLFLGLSAAEPIRFSEAENSWLQTHPEIRVAPDPDFPPIEWFDANDKFTGIASDYLALVEKKLGIRFSIVRCKNWSEVLAKAKSHEIDFLSAAAQTPGRSEYLLFSSPHIVLPGIIITRKEKTGELTLEKIRGLRASIVSGYVWQEFISRDYPQIGLDLVPDVQTGLRHVSFGQSDVFIENLATATYTIEKEGITNLRVAGETGYYTRLSFATRKDWPELNSILEKALLSVSPEEKKAIYQKWIRIEQHAVFTLKDFWIALAMCAVAVLLAVVAFFSWNHSLRRQVALRTAQIKDELSERKRVELALRESEEKFVLMVENANSIILRMDTSGTVMYFNKFAEDFFGFYRQEIIGKNVVGTIVPRRDSHGADLQAKMEDLGKHTDKYTVTENENIRKNGERVWVAWSNKPIYDKSGRQTELLCVGNDITPLKRAQDALKSERDFNAAIFDTAGALVVVLDREARIVRFNRTCEQITGYAFHEVRGKTIWDLFLVPEETPRVKDVLNNLVSGQFPNQAENFWRCKDGRVRLIAWYNTAILDDAGEVRYIVSTGIDMTEHREAEQELERHHLHTESLVEERTGELKKTVALLESEIAERKKAEEALRESEKKYRFLFEESPAGALVQGPDGTIIDISRSLAEALGYKREELIGKNVAPFVVVEQRGEQAQRLARRFQNEHHEQTEIDTLARDGSIRTMLFSGGQAILTDASGNKYAVLVAGMDISARKAMERELRNSQERYRFLFEESPAGNLIIGVDGTIKDVNSYFQKSLGYAKDELMGKPAVDFIAPDQRDRVVDALRRRMRGEEIDERDNSVLARDGSIRYVIFSDRQTFLYENDSLIGVLVSGVDVTDRRKAEMLAERQQKELIQADKLASLGILVSGVAHEINNPNNFIILNSDNLRDIWKDVLPVLDKHSRENSSFTIAGLNYLEVRDEVAQLIAGISEGAKRIRTIVQSLKDFARQGPGDMNRPVNLNAVIEQATIIIANLIKKSTDRFIVECESGLPEIRGDFQRIEQVLINLITNACQALKDRNQAVVLSTKYDSGKNMILTTVHDGGIGISSENLKHIMEPFFTTKRDSGGTGLGLAISYGIVNDHGGQLNIESEPGKGTTVTVSFPVFKEQGA